MSEWQPLGQLSLGEVGQRIDINNRSTTHQNVVLTGIHVESDVITEMNMGGPEYRYPGRKSIELEGTDCRFTVDTNATWRRSDG